MRRKRGQRLSLRWVEPTLIAWRIPLLLRGRGWVSLRSVLRSLFQPRGRLPDQAQVSTFLHVEIGLDEAELLLRVHVLLQGFEVGQAVEVAVPVVAREHPAL